MKITNMFKLCLLVLGVLKIHLLVLGMAEDHQAKIVVNEMHQCTSKPNCANDKDYFKKKEREMKTTLRQVLSSSVKTETIKVQPWKCGGPSTAIVYSPTKPGKYPVISFAHGWTAGGSAVPKDYGQYLLTPLAEAGYIVVATEDAPLNYCEEETTDQLFALSLNLTNADRSQPSGVLGHSMGGHATVRSSANAKAAKDLNIAVAVALHPAEEPFFQPVMPIFYGTGSADRIIPPAGVVSIFEQTKIKGKVLAEIKGANHFEPTDVGPNRWTPYVIAMFNCYIKKNSEACDKIYGNNASKCDLCSCTKVPMTQCSAKQGPNNTTVTKKTDETEVMQAPKLQESLVKMNTIMAQSSDTVYSGNKVQVDNVTIGQLKCDGIQTGHIVYPSDTSKTYPLLTFGHGWTEGGNAVRVNYQDVIERTAAAGYIVVAEHSGLINLCYAAETADLLRAIEFVKETPKYSAMVNWTAKVGIYGHSMGGAATGFNAANVNTIKKYNLGAAVLLHPAQGGQFAATKIPSFYATGSTDVIVPAPGVKSMYEKASSPKVYAEMTGANHFECQSKEGGITCPAGWTDVTINWFNCFIKGSVKDCIAGLGICSKIKTTQCLVDSGTHIPPDQKP
jgi:pimeloyl-ACP methyl ester carboxylesterase